MRGLNGLSKVGYSCQAGLGLLPCGQDSALSRTILPPYKVILKCNSYHEADSVPVETTPFSFWYQQNSSYQKSLEMCLHQFKMLSSIDASKELCGTFVIIVYKSCCI